jgi:hypothetical protein
LQEREWTFDEPDPGVWARLFARRMRCRSARRNESRVHWTDSRPHRPVKSGYRCIELRGDRRSAVREQMPVDPLSAPASHVV